jgi:endonuclease G
MSLKLIVLSLLIVFQSYSQALRDSILIKSNIYTIMYSETLEGPLWIEYSVRCSKSKFSRKGLDFYTDSSIRTSNNLDYYNNEYDKGHMAPAASFACDKSELLRTFSYVNCSPQWYTLNRGVWKSLEDRERQLYLKYGQVSVRIKPVYSNKSIKLKTGATVPLGYYKTLIYNNIKEVYYFPNSEPKSTQIKPYVK